MIAMMTSASNRQADDSILPAWPQDDLALLRAGDPAACRQFVRLHSPRMLAVARRILRCEHDSADAVQEAFISAFRSLQSFCGEAGLTTWLHRIVVNACLMKLRAGARRPRVSLEDLLPAFDDAGHHAHPVPCWSDRAENTHTSADLKDHIRECISHLPDGYREVLVLRDIESLDSEETARILGISVTNVKVRLHRARQAMRALLEPLFTNAAPHSGVGA